MDYLCLTFCFVPLQNELAGSHNYNGFNLPIKPLSSAQRNYAYMLITSYVATAISYELSNYLMPSSIHNERDPYTNFVIVHIPLYSCGSCNDNRMSKTMYLKYIYNKRIPHSYYVFDKMITM